MKLAKRVSNGDILITRHHLRKNDVIKVESFLTTFEN